MLSVNLCLEASEWLYFRCHENKYSQCFPWKGLHRVFFFFLNVEILKWFWVFWFLEMFICSGLQGLYLIFSSKFLVYFWMHICIIMFKLWGLNLEWKILLLFGSLWLDDNASASELRGRLLYVGWNQNLFFLIFSYFSTWCIFSYSFSMSLSCTCEQVDKFKYLHNFFLVKLCFFYWEFSYFIVEVFWLFIKCIKELWFSFPAKRCMLALYFLLHSTLWFTCSNCSIFPYAFLLLQSFCCPCWYSSIY